MDYEENGDSSKDACSKLFEWVKLVIILLFGLFSFNLLLGLFFHYLVGF